MTVADTQPPVGPLDGEYRPITISLMAAIALVSYNNLSVTAALPDIGDDLGSVGLLPWIITAELLAAAVAVLGIGPLVDTFGVRRVFRVSMVGFVVISCACAAAPNMIALIALRAAQGITAGGVIGSAIASIGLSYAPEVRPKVYAVTSAVWGVMGVGGPAVAAALISVFGWRAIFLVALPIGAGAIAIGWTRLPDRLEGTESTDFDRLGLALMTIVTIALLVGASTGSLIALAWLGLGFGVGALYVGHSRRLAAPVVHLHHLTGRRWRYIHITSTLAVAGGTGASAFLPLYLKGTRGVSQSGAAFSVLFMVMGWSVAAWASSRAQEHMHPAHVVRIGSVLLVLATGSATGLAWTEAPLPLLFGAFVVVGFGVGSVTTAGLSILQGRAGAEEMGRVSSAHQFLRALGFAYGAAVGGLVVFAVVQHRVGEVETVRELLGNDAVAVSSETIDALAAGYVAALGVTATIAAISLISATKLVAAIGSEYDAPPASAA